MPKENIEKAIKKAFKEAEGHYQEAAYEGYGPGGVAVYVECLTDNLNRTVSSLRHLFGKHGGRLAKGGSVEFLFERKGLFVVQAKEGLTEEAQLALIEAGAEDIEHEEDVATIWCSFEGFGGLQKAIEHTLLSVEHSSLHRMAKNLIAPAPEEEKRVLRLVEALEEDDDVQAVFHNMTVEKGS